MADRITELSLEAVMGERFGRYSKYIIQERALPDIRDGLKPVQRRILYAMDQDSNTYDHPYRKSAKSVGNVMGNFHPHGDSSIYEAMVRLSQDWKVREPLIDMNGNNGSIDNDPAAAMRYTESRLTKLSGEILKDLAQDTVEMVLNFDDTTYEPTVLPSRVPNLFVNGATGISAGYATDIPPHNLKEINQALVYLLDHPDASLSALMKYVKGPDFPTGGIIQGIDGIKQAYETGRGRVVVRAKTEVSDLKGGKQKIEITELPYEVVKSTLVAKIDAIRVNKEVAGITEVRDESDREGMSIVIELARDASADGILTYLFKKTDLQISYNFNMVAIHDQRPVLVTLKDGLQAFIDFRKEVVLKRSAYDLKKAQARQHIVEGLIRMLSILDEVVATIRASKNRKDATENLVDQYDFTKEQAEAIVALQLYRLTNTDVTQLEDEHKALAEKIAALQKILNEEEALHEVIRTELKAITKEYATPRLTVIEDEIESLVIDTAVTVPDEDVRILVSRNGYAKRSSLRSYKASAADNGLADDDPIILNQTANTTQHLLLFTNLGNLIYRPIFELEEYKWKEPGEHFSQALSNWDSQESIIEAFVIDDVDSEANFLLASNDGFIKQSQIKDLVPKSYKKKSAVVMKLKTADSRVVTAQPITNQTEVMVLAKTGLALRFALDDVPVVGARTAGVKAIKLGDDDQVVNVLALAATDKYLALVTNQGTFKYSAIDEISVGHRANKGMQVLSPRKTVEYHITAATALGADQAALRIETDRLKTFDIQLADHSVSSRTSNGQNLIDVKSDGQAVAIFPLNLQEND
ncbi:DNA topoisomerase IV subunit A [Fructobacillus pseudoficulneus]|uniref:DNA topoisomerase 4 subunit A n=1 Tax=Fructobacillus pseudoficulneus TaxID=220714 RepID=A0A3F3H3F6_9LACO|nr:DNA topoisomerase IV subunit A [Fructobacillus pseudoficulneus]GAP02630.1 DNA topoisomerase IV subunit A [Fructobacillus pseudoficulneus]SEH38675.1 topoisomerase-4 subunit A [Fructobacillus pseudoficulneus]